MEHGVDDVWAHLVRLTRQQASAALLNGCTERRRLQAWYRAASKAQASGAWM